MHRNYILIIIFLISTLLFSGWYFIFYRYVQNFLTDYQKTITKNTKDCLKINSLNRSCSAQKESLSAIHTNYQQCITDTKNCNDNDSMMYNIIELLEKNNLTLHHYKQISKEKNESFVRFTTMVSFQGILMHILMFFEQLSLLSNIIIPTTIELHTNSQQITDVRANITWIIYI